LKYAISTDGQRASRRCCLRRSRHWYKTTLPRPLMRLNLSVGYQDYTAGWSIRVIAKKVTDKQYLTTIATNGVVPAALARDPRAIALRLKQW
jgi:hypothetical protein